MYPDATTLERDLAFAQNAATQAGKRAMGLRALERWEGKMLADVGDQACDGYLQGMIQGRYPDDGILSEETKDSPERLEQQRCWIVDPLDGTKEYSQLRKDWAVHVALTFDGVCGIGAVDLPAQGRMLWGVATPGHVRGGMIGADGKPGDAVRGDSEPPAKLRIGCSRSHTPPWVENFAKEMDAELVPAGSVGNKVCMLFQGQADLYVHKVGLKEWDTCAPEVVARALGWHVSKLNGDEHAYNQADPYNNELLVCRPGSAERVLAALGRAGALEA